MDNKKDKNNVGFAIFCILVLECVALIQGVDGMALGIALTIIGGLGGYSLRGFVVKIFKKDGDL